MNGRRRIQVLFTCLSLVLFVLAATLCPAANAEAAAVKFDNTEYATGTNPEAVAIADLNGDGVPDLVNTNSRMWDDTCEQGLPCPGDVSVLLGNGDGTFPLPVNSPAGDRPTSLAVGDLNGDDIPDLAVVSYGSDELLALLGNGDGTFQPPSAQAVDAGVHWVALGDLNGDDRLDAVLACGGNDSFSVLLGNGDGTFQPEANYPTDGDLAWGVVIADLNEDTVEDLAVTNFHSMDVSILLGNGDGTFQPPVRYGSGGYSLNAGVADLNGDGHLDLAYGISSSSQRVGVLLGNGDGTFQGAVTYPAGSYVNGVAVGDLNGDDWPDIAVALHGDQTELFGDRGVSLLYNNGNGTFGLPHHYFLLEFSPELTAVGDLNGDGRRDVAVACSGAYNIGAAPGGVYAMINQGPMSEPWAAASTLGDGAARQASQAANWLLVLAISVGLVAVFKSRKGRNRR